MSSRSASRSVLSVEELGERLNPGALAGATGEPADGPVTPEGHQALVFYLGGIPSRPDELTQRPAPEEGRAVTPPEFVYGVELPDGPAYEPPPTPPVIDSDGRAPAPGRHRAPWLDQATRLAVAPEGAAGRHVRHRMFAIVDRTQLSEGVVLLASSLPGGGVDARDQDRLILTGPVEPDASRPSPTGDGVVTFYDQDGSVAAVALTALDPSGGAADGSTRNASHHPSVLLHRLANPDLPDTPTTRSNVFAVWVTVGF